VTPRLFGGGTLLTGDAIEQTAYEKYLAEHGNTTPLNVNALRVWAHIYGDGKPIADDPRSRDAFAAYVNDHAGSIPPTADTLRVWYAQHVQKNVGTGNGNGNGKKPVPATA